MYTFPSYPINNEVQGKIAGKDCTVVLDSGAQKAVVANDLVPVEAYTDRKMLLADYQRECTEHPVANIWVHVCDFSFRLEAAVSDKMMGETTLPRC